REKQQRARDKEEQERTLDAASAASSKRGKAGVVRSDVKASGSRSKHAAVSAQVMARSLARRARLGAGGGRGGLRVVRTAERRGCCGLSSPVADVVVDQAQVLTCSRASLRGGVCLRVRTCR
ncbi:MAG: hypothetical protein ACPIOQ_54460, partial [Promethearchaeia archaeon]